MVIDCPEIPSIDIEKATNDVDADELTGPVLSKGDLVTWTYVVKNTGNVPLTDVYVVDDVVGVVAGPISLDAGDSQKFTKTGTAVAGQYSNTAKANGTYDGTKVDDEDPSHYFGSDPAISIEKATNGDDADTETGPAVPVGSTVTWTYKVTNTGNVPLTDVYVVDDVIGVVAGPISLDAGESQKFTKTGTAVAGQYSNMATANGTYDGTKVDDDDPSHYFGSDPAISIEKATNGDDADTETGPAVPVGSTITWTYEVTNTGNVPLTDVYVVDDVIGVVAGPISLDAGESQKFTKTGTAVAGQYSNTAKANGTYDGTKVDDDDPSHYFGSDPAISIEKATNGDDADIETGPAVPVGSTITWTYEVTNTGNVPLTDVYVVDDVIGVVAGPISLDAGESQKFTKTGTAVAGQYSNMATANGTYDGTKVDDDDPSHYFGSDPAISIEKATNDVDADELTGPVLSKGDLVTWTYVVKNTGNVPLTDVYVVDDVIGVVAGPISLDAGKSQTFTKTGTAVVGQYSNMATANGTYDGTKVDDEDPSHYIVNPDPSIDIEKATNDVDADELTGPVLSKGDLVTWTYVVKNTGNVPLTDVYVVDDVIGVVAGPISLDAGKSQTFTKTGTAVAGQYSNMATANGTYDGTKVEDTDPSHYIVNPDPSIDIEKATNDVDADELTGPVLSKGDMVTWTYVVKNTGNVPLTDVYVVDDVIGVVAGPISLDAGKSQTFTKTGTAELGQYSNMATANGTYDGTKVEDTDPSHYVVQPDPSIDIEKATNGYDADEPTGPILNVGDEVTWSYVVTNTGNVPLTSVYVVDDVIGVVAGPINLGLGESQTSTKTGTAELGQYSNIATANGTYDGTEVYDDDPSHYFGSAPLEPVVLEPGLEVYKTASPISGTPCDDVIFTIVVMNTGEFPLILEVTDTIPPGMSYVSSSPEPDIAMKNANGSWTVVWKSNLEALDPGNSTEILLVAHIDEDIPASSSPDNVLTILSSSEDEVLRIQQVSGGMAEKLQDLEWMKVRLEIELRKMIELRERFDKDAADLKVETPPSEGAGYTVYNYTDSVTEENLVLFEDSQGNLAISEYINPKLDAVLTTEYGPRGVAISDSYLSRDGMEGLRIDYYMPYAGYRVYTINYRTGDTLIDTFDARGNLINREYRRTPGIPKEKVFTVRNCVTATGTYEAGQVSASDCADVTVNYLSDLKLTKVPSPTTATVGTPVLYTYTVENTGTTTISNILLFDDKLNQLVDLNRTVLKPGETAIGTATYTVLFEDLPGPVINNATVTGTDPQGTELTDLASATVPIYYSEIVLVKTPDKTGVVVGDVVTYTYLVTNIGTTTITDLTLFDDKLNKFLPLNRTTIGPGESAMATAEYEALAEDIPGPIVNNATVEGIDEKEDPVTAEDFASVDILQPQIQLSGLTVTKIADKTEVRPGEEVVYNITICNYHGIVDVIDTFNRDVEFVSADPSPNVGHRRQIWKSLSIDGCRSITLVVRTKKPQNFTFDMDQGVEGVGFVNVANDYNTAYPTYVLINNVEVTEPDNPENILNRTTENVYVRDLGTELETREHGSGTYENEEQIRMRTANKSISMDKDVSATYSKTNLGLYNNRTVTYSSKWTEEAKAKNWITGASLTESYRYADFIDRESSFDVDENGSIMEFETEFSGMGHVGALKKSDPNDTARDTPIFELREDYVGTFRTYQKVDEYGKNVGYEASTSGEGFVAADRRVGESQRSYEYGSGSYNSEDLIRTETNYIAKDISLVYAPTSHSLTDDVSVDSSMKWKEGMYSRTKGISYIGEEYTSIDRLEKESIFRGLNDLSSEADFSGTARYRVMLADETGNASGNGADKEAMIDFDEIYTGDYSVAKRIVLTGVPKYNRPHLSVAKIGKIDSGSSLAEYTITVTNDGNVVLDTISIEDTFPQGTEFLSASLRPTEVTSDTAKWNNILSLPVGDVLAIDLVLNVTDYSGHLVNVVKATAQHGENLTLSATNFSVLDASWLSCCPSEVFASKTATIDPVLQNVVTYRLTVQNLAESPAVARIDDEIPSGMKLLGSSVMPSKYDEPDGRISWIVADIAPGELKTIEYMVEARYDGRYVNVARIDPYTLDGEELQQITVSSVVEIGPFEGAEVPPGWVPPDWDFEYYSYGCTSGQGCEDCSCLE